MVRLKRLAISAGLFAALCLFSAASARADTITITAGNSGWFAANGFHNGANQNYLAGDFGSYRNFFTFDLSGVSGTITGATLRLFNPADRFAVDPGTYTLYDVLTPASALGLTYAATPEGLAIFEDLGSGTVFGTLDVSSAPGGTVISINLNAAALAALNSAGNGVFAIGGAVLGGDGRIFADTGSGSTRELVLQTSAPAAVPEPLTLVMFGTGLAGVAALRRRARQGRASPDCD